MKYGLYDTEQGSWLADGPDLPILQYDTIREAQLAAIISDRQCLWRAGRTVAKPIPPGGYWVQEDIFDTGRTEAQARQELIEEGLLKPQQKSPLRLVTRNGKRL